MPDYGQSVRLNAEMRERFKRTVKEKVLGPSPSHGDFKKKWAPKIYDIAIGEKLHKAFQDLPDWTMQETSELTVYLGVDKDKKRVLEFSLPKPIRRPYQIGSTNSYSASFMIKAPVVDAEEPICKAFEKHLQAQEDWFKKQRALSKQLNELIDPLNTTLQLYKAWPGAWEYKDCFPYVPRRKASTQVSAMEMEVGLKMSKITVNPDVEEN